MLSVAEIECMSKQHWWNGADKGRSVTVTIGGTMLTRDDL